MALAILNSQRCFFLKPSQPHLLRAPTSQQFSAYSVPPSTMAGNSTEYNDRLPRFLTSRATGHEAEMAMIRLYDLGSDRDQPLRGMILTLTPQPEDMYLQTAPQIENENQATKAKKEIKTNNAKNERRTAWRKRLSSPSTDRYPSSVGTDRGGSGPSSPAHRPCANRKPFLSHPRQSPHNRGVAQVDTCSESVQ